jgi:peptidoglycan hydrolase CwlO-like protein
LYYEKINNLKKNIKTLEKEIEETNNKIRVLERSNPYVGFDL